MGNDPTPAPTPQPQPPAPPQDPAPPQPAPPSEPKPSTGKPAEPTGDDDNAVRRIQAERDALKDQLKEAQDKLSAAKTLEDIEKAKQEVQADFERQLLDKSIDVELTRAGCVDVAATKAHIDASKLKRDGEKVEGLDTAALIKSYPYLFSQVPKTSTGASPAGAPNKTGELDAQLRKAAGLPDEK